MRARSLTGLALLLGLASGALAQQRASTGQPVRTGLPGQVQRTTMGQTLRPLPGSYSFNGNRYTGAGLGWSGTSLHIDGNGWELHLNGSLANVLASYSWGTGRGYLGPYSGLGYGSPACVAVFNADEFLRDLPSWLRDRAHVLRGADYGWDYDIVCFPRWNGSSWVYVPLGTGYGWYPSGYSYRDGRIYVDETAGWGTLATGSTADRSGASGAPDAAAASVEPPKPIDVARISLVMGDLKSAEAQYRVHLKEHPADSEALREYGLVMLESDRADEGFAAIRKAYRDKPELAETPIDLASLGFDGNRVRHLMGIVSPEANQLKSASAWLTLSVMLQAQGKDGLALKFLKKASGQGLDKPIVDAMEARLTR
ncbi:MAG: hypothetical protein Kow0022_00380 [Phycisphaerales bacterium]